MKEMKQSDFLYYAGKLLSIHKKKINEFHCQRVNCCGICDKFYPCLFDLLKNIKNKAIEGRKKSQKWLEEQVRKER